MEEVLFEPDHLQMRLHRTALQLSGICTSFTAVHERLDQHSTSSIASHLRSEALLSSWVSSSVDGVARRVGDRDPTYGMRLSCAIFSALKRLKMVFKNTLELLRAVR